MKKILVTGAAGFLGSHLSEKLCSKGYDVIGVDNMTGGYSDNVPKNITFFSYDCCDLKKMHAVMKGVDIVYHCAATAHEGLSVFSPYTITKSIYGASVSTITAAIANKVKRFVYCSSMARYGSQSFPFTEDMKTKPEDPYGIAKVAAEDTLKLLAKVHGIEWNIAVPHNIIGPNQKYDDPFRNVLSIFINRNLQGKPALIYGDGEQKRTFSYIDDVIYCLEKLAFDKNINKEIINVGPDEESITIKNLANLVANEVGYNGKAVHMPARPQEVKIATCSAEKSRRLLNYSTKTTLKEAIKYTANYIRKMGTRPFKYYLPIEIINDKTPQSWIKKTI